MSRSLTRRELGFHFEDQVHSLLTTTNQYVLREKEIVQKYGKLANGVDHLICINDQNKTIIAIQDKWRASSQQLHDINHFISCVRHIERTEQKYVIGIYVTKKPITSGAIQSLNEENKICNRYHHISNSNMNHVMHKLMCVLYYLGIYMYDPDGSTIMLDETFYS